MVSDDGSSSDDNESVGDNKKRSKNDGRATSDIRGQQASYAYSAFDAVRDAQAIKAEENEEREYVRHLNERTKGNKRKLQAVSNEETAATINRLEEQSAPVIDNVGSLLLPSPGSSATAAKAQDENIPERPSVATAATITTATHEPDENVPKNANAPPVTSPSRASTRKDSVEASQVMQTHIN